MRSCEVLIVGGGPAGPRPHGSCMQAGTDVLVLDQRALSAAETLRRLDHAGGGARLWMDVAAYPHRFLTFHVCACISKGLHLPVPCVQHSIRRLEFDAWLLERSGAEVLEHTYGTSSRGGDYLIDDAVPLPLPDRRGRHALPGVPHALPELNPRASELQP